MSRRNSPTGEVFVVLMTKYPMTNEIRMTNDDTNIARRRLTLCASCFVLLLSLGISSFVIPPPASAQETERLPGERDRTALTAAFSQHRLRELAWLTSRAAYLAHARTLEHSRQPADAGVALLYVALTELHAGDLAAARRSLTRSRELLGDAGKPNPVHEDARRLSDFWRTRLDARDEPISATARLAKDGRPQQREVVLWLQPDENSNKSRTEPTSSEPLAYRMLDPAVFTEELHVAVSSWPSTGDESQTLCSTAWRAVLLDDRKLAESVLETLKFTSTDDEDRHESDCLRLACAARVGRTEIVESSWQRLREAEWLPLWGLRALSLVAGNDSRNLAMAQQSVRTLIGDRHPFDSLLLFPQERDRWAKSDWLRDCYWEVGCLHGEQGVASHGRWLAFPAAKEFVRSERLLSELKAPLRLGSRSPMTPLRTVTTALACARIGDFESWPNDAVGESLPFWNEVSTLAREVAGDLRTHSPGQVIDREEETRVEPLEWLLLGTELESTSTNAAHFVEDRGESTETVSVTRRWFLWSTLLLAVVVLAGLWRRFRAG